MFSSIHWDRHGCSIGYDDYEYEWYIHYGQSELVDCHSSNPLTFISQNKELSDETDRILELQGVGWWKRTAIRLATITLYVKHYIEDGLERIDIKQTLTGGIEGTEENRKIDWTERKHTDKLFGPVGKRKKPYFLLSLNLSIVRQVSKTRRIKVEEVQDEFLRTGWLSEAVEPGVINSYVVSDKPKDSNEYWVAEQVSISASIASSFGDGFVLVGVGIRIN